MSQIQDAPAKVHNQAQDHQHDAYQDQSFPHILKHAATSPFPFFILAYLEQRCYLAKVQRILVILTW